MKIKHLCVYYCISLLIITFGMYSFGNYSTANSLWDTDLCPSSINAHKQLGENLNLDLCYKSQHSVQMALIATIIGLDLFATMIFIIGLDVNRTKRLDNKMEKQ